MKKIILIGRSESGKTTLTQALRGEKIHYQKTQYTNHFDVIIDTPGEYIQTKTLGAALAMYTFEAQVVGLLVSATEPYSVFSPAITSPRPHLPHQYPPPHPTPPCQSPKRKCSAANWPGPGLS